MPKVHNKRRNAALVYEFLIRYMSNALVENDQKRANAVLKIVKRYYKQGTLLAKEQKLIDALIKTTVSSEATASSILQEAKHAARSYDVAELDREKSLLIAAINKSIRDDNFFDQPISEYRMLATTQTLVNDWREKDIDIRRVGEYEDKLVKWLVTEKQPLQEQVISNDMSIGENRLLMKMMMQRVNAKYAGMLSQQQKEILRAYAFSTISDNVDVMRMKLLEIKSNVLKEISEHQTSLDSEFVVKKLTEVRDMVSSELLESVDDETVTRFMLYTKLCSEFKSENV